MKSKTRNILVTLAMTLTLGAGITACGAKQADIDNSTEWVMLNNTELDEVEVETESVEVSTEDVEVSTEAVTETTEVKEEEAETADVKEMNAVKYASSTVNVRKGPSPETDRLGSLNTNDKVAVTGETNDGWYRIDYNGKVGYVSSKYLSDNMVAASKSKPAESTEKASSTAKSESSENTSSTGNTTSNEQTQQSSGSNEQTQVVQQEQSVQQTPEQTVQQTPEQTVQQTPEQAPASNGSSTVVEAGGMSIEELSQISGATDIYNAAENQATDAEAGIPGGDWVH